MDVNTGKIYQTGNVKSLDELQKKLNTKLVPLTSQRAKELKPLSKRKRKWLMRNGSCICGSGKSFKKCCLNKYRKIK